MKNLFLIRGVPGAGKTTLVESLKADIAFSADDFHMDIDGNYNWKPENIKPAHIWCQTQAMNSMMIGYDVVIANTFVEEWELLPYINMAKRFEYRVTTLIVENRHGSKDIHNVPEDTIRAMKERFQVVL